MNRSYSSTKRATASKPNNDSDYRSSSIEHDKYASIEKELILLKAKEKSYIANQKEISEKLRRLESNYESREKQVQDLRRDLVYANRQVESLKNELIYAEVTTLKNDYSGYRHNQY